MDITPNTYSDCKNGAVIYAIDDAESTVYVLVEQGAVTQMAHWPGPLEQFAPHATYGGTLGGDEGRLVAPGRELQLDLLGLLSDLRVDPSEALATLQDLSTAGAIQAGL